MALTEEALMAIRQKSQPSQGETISTETTESESAIQPEAEVEQTEATTEQKVADVPNDGEQVEVKDEPVTGWDDDETKESVQSEIKIEEWVSDLGLGEIKTKDEIKTKVSELQSKLKQLEEKPLEGLNDELKDVIKVAQTGGWEEAKQMLASQLIDYSKLDPLAEFERDFINRNQNNPKYFTDGKYDHQKVLDAIDTLPEVTRELYGSNIIQAEADLAERQRAAIRAKTEARRTEAEKSLSQSTKSLSEILPLDTYGIKFEPRHSSEIYEGIVSSKLTKKHLGLSYDDLVRSGADMKAITRSITLAEKGEKMISYKAKNSEVKSKKEILQKTQNVQLNTTTTAPNPEDQEKKVVSTVDKMKELIQAQRRGL